MKPDTIRESRRLICRGYFYCVGLWLLEGNTLEYRCLGRRTRPACRFKSEFIQQVVAHDEMLVTSTIVSVHRPTPAIRGVLLFTDLDRRPQFYFSDQELDPATAADIFRSASRLPAVLAGDRLYLNSRFASEWPDSVAFLNDTIPAEQVLIVDPAEGSPSRVLPPERMIQITKERSELFRYPLTE